MSGHSHFISIGGAPKIPAVMPQANDMPGDGPVGGVRPAQGANQVEPGANVQAPRQNVQQDANAESANALMRRLDVLLSRAAANATKAVDAGGVKKALSRLELPPATVKAIGELADKAESSLKAINTFTGRQIGESVSVEGGRMVWGANSRTAAAIRDAIDAQLKLSGILRKLVNSLPCCDVANSLTEVVFQCDRRASEIQMLVNELADLAEKGGNAGPEVKTRLETTLARLLPRKYLEMHGNDAAIEAIKTQVEPVAKRLDAISKNPGASLSKQEVETVKREIDTMSNALDAAAKSGLANGVFADRTLFGAARDVLDTVKGKIVNARSEIANASIGHFAEKVFSSPNMPILSAAYLPFLKVVAPTLALAAETRESLCKAAKNYAKKPDKQNLARMRQLADRLAAFSVKELGGEINDLYMYSSKEKEPGNKKVRENLTFEATEEKFRRDLESADPEVRNACTGPRLQQFVNLLLELRDGTRKAAAQKQTPPVVVLCNVFDPPGGLASQVAHLEMLVKNAKNLKEQKYQTGATVLAAFEGRLRFSTLVESRLRGIADEDVNPALDDVNIESSKVLGGGKVNTVHEVACKDGSKYVFKPESEGRQKIGSLYLSTGIEKQQMVAGLNMASQKTAEALGLDDVMAKTTAGAHNGSFGIFMEKAPGLAAETWRKSNKPGAQPEKTLSPDQIKALPDGDYAKVVGGLMRQANRLEWFDLIAGQGDRHPGNYMIAVDADDFSVTMKGIDNDACHPAYRTGMQTYELDVDTSLKFQLNIEEATEKLYPPFEPNAKHTRRQAGDFANAIFNTDPGITIRNDGNVTVDVSKAKSPLVAVALMSTVGIQSAALPGWIDEDLYNRLVELGRAGDARKKYISDLKARLPKPAADAALKRLDDAVAHAKKLAAEGKVVSAAAWLDHDMQRSIAGEIQQNRKPGCMKIPKNEANDPEYNKAGAKSVGMDAYYISKDYFVRDLVRAVAKDGWFKEEPAKA